MMILQRRKDNKIVSSLPRILLTYLLSFLTKHKENKGGGNERNDQQKEEQTKKVEKRKRN